jgi:hypothetical protein
MESALAYAYKLKDRVMEVIRWEMDRAVSKPDAEVEQLQGRVVDLEQLAEDQAMAIRGLNKKSAVIEIRTTHSLSYHRIVQIFGGPV